MKTGGGQSADGFPCPSVVIFLCLTSESVKFENQVLPWVIYEVPLLDPAIKTSIPHLLDESAILSAVHSVSLLSQIMMVI